MLLMKLMNNYYNKTTTPFMIENITIVLFYAESNCWSLS